MAFDFIKYQSIKARVGERVQIVPVTKTKPVSDIEAAYADGVRDFGENYVQELRDKQPLLPSDVRWHFIGHLQSNKVKYIASYVHMIQSVDSAALLREIQKQAKKHNRVIRVLLQVHVAQEETKFGWDTDELVSWLSTNEWKKWENILIEGVMGMASFVEDQEQIKREFDLIHGCFNRLNSEIFIQTPLTTVSMGMSGDWEWAVNRGSTLIRIGSALFGARN
jgi:pyridoxal phosphate enzyme (YggS family)